MILDNNMTGDDMKYEVNIILLLLLLYYVFIFNIYIEIS